MLPLAMLVAPGMHASWKRADFGRTKTILSVLLAIAVVIAIILAAGVYGWHSLLGTVGFAVALWVAFAALIEPIDRLRKGHSLSAGIVGMSVAHFGLAMFILGVTATESYRREADLSLRPGESAQLAGFDFKMTKLGDVEGPNYEAVEAEIVVTRDGEEVAVLHPQKRVYRVQRNPMTEAGIDSGWRHHLLVSMGAPLGDGAWSLRLQYKPLVRFIWFGAFTIALGGLIGAMDRRYRQRVPAGAAEVVPGAKTA
jgi:cytochrome c-type biogenesis protein CcmF